MHEKKKGDTKDHPHGQYFIKFSEADELLKLAEARQQVSVFLLISFELLCNINVNYKLQS